MSCLSALPAQIITFLSVPQDILLLRHRVFREYARIAVGPDFIHTFPSLIVFAAMCVVLWKNPPKFMCLSIVSHMPLVYKLVQVIIFISFYHIILMKFDELFIRLI